MKTLEPIPFDELDDALRQLLAPRVERLGYLGDFFGFGAYQPAALAAFVEFSELLKDALPWRLVEAVALTIAAETENAYERTQHERLAARLGMSAAEIELLVTLRAMAPPFDPAAIAAVELARGCVAGGHGSRAPFDRLRDLTDDSTAIGVLLLCGRYVAHAAIANTLELSPPMAPSQGE